MPPPAPVHRVIRRTEWCVSRGLKARMPAVAAGGLALIALVVSSWWGSWVAGGSDSYCYVALAQMLVDGSILAPAAPGFPLTWTNGALSIVPTGFTPSPVVPGGMAPICSPGLGLMMAAVQALAGPLGAFAVVPIAGAVTVWSAFVLGRRMGGATAGLVAALLTLTSPIFLYQLMQPMSDVPAAALWVAAFALVGRRTPAGHLLAGLSAGTALAIRPNLLPLAIPLGVLPLLQSPGTGGSALRVREMSQIAAGAVVPLATMLWLNQTLYGSPLSSGYGDPALLFKWKHVPQNLALYPNWLIGSQSPWILVGLTAPLWLRRRKDAPGAGYSPAILSAAGVAALAGALLVYLPYVVFDSWSYLRFLLPGVILLVVSSSAVTARGLRLLPARMGVATLSLLALALAGWSVQMARERHAFDLRLSESRFAEAGEWIDRRLPRDAVVLTIWHSGSVRMYGRRFTVLWDAIEPDELDSVVASLRMAGRTPYLLLENFEVPVFKARFAGHSPVSGLDWPPRAQIGRELVLFDPLDRARFYAGERVPTERVWTAAERAALRRR